MNRDKSRLMRVARRLNDVPGKKRRSPVRFEIVTRCTGSGMINGRGGRRKESKQL